MEDSLDVVGEGGLAVGEGIEVAVAAFADAERDMNVETFHSESPLTLYICFDVSLPKQSTFGSRLAL